MPSMWQVLGTWAIKWSLAGEDSTCIKQTNKNSMPVKGEPHCSLADTQSLTQSSHRPTLGEEQTPKARGVKQPPHVPQGVSVLGFPALMPSKSTQ